MLDGETIAKWFEDHKQIKLSDIEVADLDEFVARERRKGVHIPVQTVRLDMQTFDKDGKAGVRTLEIYPLPWAMLKKGFGAVSQLESEGSNLADDKAVEEFTKFVAEAAKRNNRDITAEEIENGCDMAQIVKAFTELTKIKGATNFVMDLAAMTAMALGEEGESENPT